MEQVKLTLSLLELTQIKFLNILKMLKRREVIDDVDSIYKSNIPKSFNTNVIKFKSDISDQKVNIYFVNSPISSISKNSSIEDFLNENIKIKKILIVPKITKKVFKQIIYNYSNAEVFSYQEMMEDIPTKQFIPNHRILKEEEKEILKKKYNLKDLPKIQSFDMMIRYLNAPINSVVVINRVNVNSGSSVAYRLVVEGNIDHYF